MNTFYKVFSIETTLSIESRRKSKSASNIRCIYSTPIFEYFQMREQGDFHAANDVTNVIIALDDDLTTHILADDWDDAFKATQDRCVLSCLERLLDALEDPLTANFLCEQIRKELFFHILCGSCWTKERTQRKPPLT